MKIVSVRDFTNHFATLSHAPLQVRRRGKTVGTWTPSTKAPEPIDVMKRLKQDFKQPLPFTGVELLKSGKKQ